MIGARANALTRAFLDGVYCGLSAPVERAAVPAGPCVDPALNASW